MTRAIPQRRSWLWLQGLACGALLSVATAPAILMATLLAPGIVTYVVEREPRKPLSESMLLLSLATTFMPLRLLWEGGHTMQGCIDLLSDPAHLGLSWLAAAAAWLMCETGRLISRFIAETSVRRDIAKLEKEREALAGEWGRQDPQPTPRV